MAEAVLHARGWVLDRQSAPKPFDFRVMPGELWMLVGAVDSGRRELIHSLAGLVEPEAGRLELFGLDVARLGLRARARLHRQIGVVLEQPGLVPAWSVFENLALLVRYHRLVPGDAVEDYVVEFVESCRLPPAILRRLASELSPLESQWISLLRALVISCFQRGTSVPSGPAPSVISVCSSPIRSPPITCRLRDNHSRGTMVNGSWMLRITWLRMSARYESTPATMMAMAGKDVTTSPIW